MLSKGHLQDWDPHLLLQQMPASILCCALEICSREQSLFRRGAAGDFPQVGRISLHHHTTHTQNPRHLVSESLQLFHITAIPDTPQGRWGSAGL